MAARAHLPVAQVGPQQRLVTLLGQRPAPPPAAGVGGGAGCTVAGVRRVGGRVGGILGVSYVEGILGFY